jgi:hypothetical protein
MNNERQERTALIREALDRLLDMSEAWTEVVRGIREFLDSDMDEKEWNARAQRLRLILDCHMGNKVFWQGDIQVPMMPQINEKVAIRAILWELNKHRTNDRLRKERRQWREFLDREDCGWPSAEP